MKIYLLESSSRILLDEEIERILNHNQNKIIFNGETASIEDILSEASYVSMFEEMKYLIIKNANFFGNIKLKEEEEKSLLAYLEQPYPLCTLIFTVSEPCDGRKKITKKMKEDYTYKLIPTLKGLDLYNKVANKCVENKYILEKDSINYLINACLGNYDLICNEISKIDLYYSKPAKVSMDVLKNIVSKILVDNNFKFIDAVIGKDYQKSLQLLDDLMTLKVEPLSLLNLLAREIRLMIEFIALEPLKMTGKDMTKELGLQDWQLDKVRRNAMNYHEEDLGDYLILLEELDYKIKSGEIDKLIGLKMFLLEMFEY